MEPVASTPMLVIEATAPGTRIYELNHHIKRLVYPLFKTFVFLIFSVFILCVPLGDPARECPRAVCQATPPHDVGKVVAYSYMCNLYKFMSTTALLTTDTFSKVSKFTGCVIMNALYDAKLKFYNILETVDRRDVCRFVCCSEAEETEEPIQVNVPKEKKCKCKGKFKRQ